MPWRAANNYQLLILRISLIGFYLFEVYMDFLIISIILLPIFTICSIPTIRYIIKFKESDMDINIHELDELIKEFRYNHIG